MSTQKHTYTFGVSWDCGVKGHSHFKLADFLACNRERQAKGPSSG